MPVLPDDPLVVVVCAAAAAPAATTPRNTKRRGDARIIDREMCIRSSSTAAGPSVGIHPAKPGHTAWTLPCSNGAAGHTRNMTTILVVCHTSEGQTARIADHVAAVLQDLGDEVEVHDVAGAPAPEHYDGVIVGDSIHTVHHSRALTRYVHDHVAVLNKLPAALFQVSPTSADADDEHTPPRSGSCRSCSTAPTSIPTWSGCSPAHSCTRSTAGSSVG